MEGEREGEFSATGGETTVDEGTKADGGGKKKRRLQQKGGMSILGALDTLQVVPVNHGRDVGEARVKEVDVGYQEEASLAASVMRFALLIAKAVGT